MKLNRIIILGLISTTLLVGSCKESVFGPNSADVIGVVKDRFGRPIESVRLTTLVLDSNSAAATSTSSDANGSYQLLGIPLGTIQVSAELRGYQDDIRSIHLEQDNNNGILDFNLVGAPEISSIVFDSDSAFIAKMDTINVSVSTIDVYNSPNTSYDLDLSGIVKDSNGIVVKIYDLETSNSQQNQLFSFSILAVDFTNGNYTIDFIVYDEDNLFSLTKSKDFIIAL